MKINNIIKELYYLDEQSKGYNDFVSSSLRKRKERYRKLERNFVSRLSKEQLRDFLDIEINIKPVKPIDESDVFVKGFNVGFKMFSEILK